MLKDYDRTSSQKQVLNKLKKIKRRSLQLVRVNVSNFYLYTVHVIYFLAMINDGYIGLDD